MNKGIIIIADAGSTKTDWAGLDGNGKLLFRLKTTGLNPELISPDEFLHRLHQSEILKKYAAQSGEIFFYGAGCGTEDAVKKVHHILEKFFPAARIHVAEDMLGAALAASQGREAVVAILGTGSNSAYFDGRAIHPHVVSLGYILMDEGSGNWLGKHLLLDYYYRRMPGNLAEAFAAQYDLTPATVKQHLYYGKNPSEYLAHFSRFLSQYHNTGYGSKLLSEGFDLFIRNRLLPYAAIHEVPLYFVGSVAYFYQDILKNRLEKHALKAADILRTPMENLIQFHRMD